MVAPTMKAGENTSIKRTRSAKRGGSSGAPTPTERVEPLQRAVKSDLWSGEMRFAREICQRHVKFACGERKESIFSSEFRMKNLTN
ncbi:MAG TPA: hypothetical protein DDY70_04360 [Clostridiales bacterium]|nr:hypothetical protein [Clostridiales bacterium]